MTQVTEALSWRVAVFSPSDVMVQVCVPPLEVAQLGVKVLVAWTC